MLVDLDIIKKMASTTYESIKKIQSIDLEKYKHLLYKIGVVVLLSHIPNNAKALSTEPNWNINMNSNQYLLLINDVTNDYISIFRYGSKKVDAETGVRDFINIFNCQNAVIVTNENKTSFTCEIDNQTRYFVYWRSVKHGSDFAICSTLELGVNEWNLIQNAQELKSFMYDDGLY